MAERLQTVLEAAERAAEAIRYDAEEQARRHLAGAQQRADGLTAERVRLISQLTDDLIEHIFLFAPLHDIGKIAIPDEILRKPGTLTDKERAIMRSHTAKGREIIDVMLNNFGLDGLEHIDNGDVAVVKTSRQDGTTIDEYARYIEPQHRHHHTG